MFFFRLFRFFFPLSSLSHPNLGPIPSNGDFPLWGCLCSLGAAAWAQKYLKPPDSGSAMGGEKNRKNSGGKKTTWGFWESQLQLDLCSWKGKKRVVVGKEQPPKSTHQPFSCTKPKVKMTIFCRVKAQKVPTELSSLEKQPQLLHYVKKAGEKKENQNKTLSQP